MKIAKTIRNNKGGIISYIVILGFVIIIALSFSIYFMGFDFVKETVPFDMIEKEKDGQWKLMNIQHRTIASFSKEQVKSIWCHADKIGGGGGGKGGIGSRPFTIIYRITVFLTNEKGFHMETKDKSTYHKYRELIVAMNLPPDKMWFKE